MISSGIYVTFCWNDLSFFGLCIENDRWRRRPSLSLKAQLHCSMNLCSLACSCRFFQLQSTISEAEEIIKDTSSRSRLHIKSNHAFSLQKSSTNDFLKGTRKILNNILTTKNTIILNFFNFCLLQTRGFIQNTTI